MTPFNGKPTCDKPVMKGYHLYPCGNRASFVREGKHYCKRHDPVAKQERDELERKAFAERKAADDAIFAEGRKIADTLGITCDVYYSHIGGIAHRGIRRALVVDYDTLLKIIKEREK